MGPDLLMSRRGSETKSLYSSYRHTLLVLLLINLLVAIFSQKLHSLPTDLVSFVNIVLVPLKPRKDFIAEQYLEMLS